MCNTKSEKLISGEVQIRNGDGGVGGGRTKYPKINKWGLGGEGGGSDYYLELESTCFEVWSLKKCKETCKVQCGSSQWKV